MTSRTQDGFIWTSGGTGTMGLATEAVTASSQNLKDDYDVIIIGAGFAGLAAARDLASSHSLSVLLVEARDRIGGRTCTVKERDQEFEIGGQWVHWWQPHVLRELSRYGLAGHLIASTADGEDILGMQESDIEAILAEFFTVGGLTARQLMPWPMDVFREPATWKRYDHLSIRDRLDAMPNLSEDSRSLIELNYTGNSGADAANTAFVGALRWYALGGYSFAGTNAVGGTYKIGNGGMTSLAKAMLEETNCDRMFSTEVARIAQDDDPVKVETRTGRVLTAANVICTIPLNVLSTIDFDPPLPALQQEAADRGMPHKGGKIILELKHKQPCDIAGGACGRSPFMFSMSDDYERDANGSTAVAFTWPSPFPPENNLTDAHTVVSALEELVKAPIVSYLTHDWANDKHARGAWISFRPGDMSKYSEALQQTHGRAVMASADWAKGFAGFVDGAIEQGAKAASEVARGSRKQAA